MIESESSAVLDVRPLAPGSRLGHLQIVRRVAVGGMAELYLGRVEGSGPGDAALAIKRVHPHLAQDREFAAMFLQEARIAATLHHPNIVRLVELGDDPHEMFYAMEYLHGEDVRSILREAVHRGGIPVECALAIVVGAGSGLHHAHNAAGVVHRDVAPSNVVVTFDGEVKVVDFGIAKTMSQTRQTQAGVLKGKIGYMSPEACRGESVDRRADVFGLGVLLYETTTGQRLFFAENQFAIMNKIVTGAFDPPSEVAPGYPEGLERIVMKALATEPEDRYQTAQDMVDALAAFASAAAIRVTPTPLPQFMHALFGMREDPRVAVLAELPTDPPGQRRRVSGLTVAAMAAIPVALGLGVVLGGGLWGNSQPRPDPRPEPSPESEAPAMSVVTPEPPPAAAPAAPLQAEPQPDDEPQGDAAPPNTGPRSTSPRTRRKRKPKRDAEKRPQPTADGDAGDRLFPDAYYENR